SGALGQPVIANIAFVHGLTREGREWITDPRQAGGGVLFDSGSHAVDLFRHLIGDVDQVHGMISAAETGAVEDAGVVCLRSGRVLGTIMLSWKTPPWQGVVELVGTLGRARVDYDGEQVSLRTRVDDGLWRKVRTSNESRFVAQMRHFLARIRGEETPA